MNTLEKQRIQKIIEEFKNTHNKPWAARKNLADATDGILNPATMANRDSLGTGIQGLFYIGRCACYPTSEVVNFLKREAGVL